MTDRARRRNASESSAGQRFPGQQLRAIHRLRTVIGVLWLGLVCVATPVASQDQDLSKSIRRFAADQPTESDPTAPGADIWSAVRTGNTGAIEAQLARDIDLDQPDSEHGYTPLSWASLRGDTASARLLIERGADVNARNRNGSTPLHGAALLGHPEVAKWLIKAGADIDVRDFRRRDSPIDATRTDARATERLAARLTINVDRTALLVGREEVAQLLRAEGASDPRGMLRRMLWIGAATVLALTLLAVVIQITACGWLAWALSGVPVEHRRVPVWGIWLAAIPGLSVFANFLVVPRVSRSYAAAFKARGRPDIDGANALGWCYCVLHVGAWIPGMSALCGLGSLVLLIVYLYKLGLLRQTLRAERPGDPPPPDSGRTAIEKGSVALQPPPPRRHDLDALRGAAMLLGIALHGAMSFGVGIWPIVDTQPNGGFRWLFSAIHGFRMPLFFLLSGFFTAMLWRQRGVRAMLWHRCRRIGVPFVIGVSTIVPATNAVTVLLIIVPLWSANPPHEPVAVPQRVAAASQPSAGPTHQPDELGGPLVDLPGLIGSYGLGAFLLMYVPYFGHLWFLWFLCWLVPAFGLYAMTVDKLGWKGPPRWLVVTPCRFLWLLPLTMVFQAAMVLRLPWFGPDTSAGVIPAPHVLGYFAVFFAFGALYYDCDDHPGRVGRWWWVSLPLGLLVILPYGFTHPEIAKPFAVGLQVVYTWSMTFGMMGLFRQLLPTERKVIRYLADSSYWLYVTHVPFILVGQAIVYAWPVPATLKFVLLCGSVVGLLLWVYHGVVRYSWLGSALNGPRQRPLPRLPATPPQALSGSTVAESLAR